MKNEVRLFWIVLLLFLAAIALAITGDYFRCKSNVRARMQEDFIECSRNEGDAGCDSCYYRVYGYCVDWHGNRDTTTVTNTAWIQSHQDYLNSKR